MYNRIFLAFLLSLVGHSIPVLLKVAAVLKGALILTWLAPALAAVFTGMLFNRLRDAFLIAAVLGTLSWLLLLVVVFIHKFGIRSILAIDFPSYGLGLAALALASGLLASLGYAIRRISTRA